MSLNQALRRAMGDPDHWVVALDYVDSKGESTQRVVSPIRFLGPRRFLALCLCREEPRQFYLERCNNVRLLRAEEVMMPLPM